jgi:hypothetical protein
MSFKTNTAIAEPPDPETAVPPVEDSGGGEPIEADPTTPTGGSGSSFDEIQSPNLSNTPGDPYDAVRKKVKLFVGALLVVGLVVAVISIIVGGYIYVTAGADESRATQGRNALIGAAVGLVIIFGAYALTTFISSRLGPVSSTTKEVVPK